MGSIYVQFQPVWTFLSHWLLILEDTAYLGLDVQLVLCFLLGLSLIYSSTCTNKYLQYFI